MQMKKYSDEAIYRIKVKGCLGRKWTNFFDGMKIECSKDETILYGTVKDRSALHGILNRIRDLNLVLISVDRLEE